MKAIARVRLLVLMAVLIAALGGVVVAQQRTLITLPPVTRLAVGESVTLNAEITCAEGYCSAFEIELTYDPAIIRVESVRLGGYLGADTIIPHHSVENGRITLNAAAKGIPAQQSDVLFSLVVTGVGVGTTYIFPESWAVGDVQKVPLSVTSAQILVGGGAPPNNPPNLPNLPRRRVTSNADWRQSDIDQYARAVDGIEMVYVPLGCIRMGNDPNAVGSSLSVGRLGVGDGGEACFDSPFFISRTEITNAQFDQLGCRAGIPSHWTDPQRPRAEVSWAEARDCASRAGMRLPTEAEWEYAARGPDALLYPWGITGILTIWSGRETPIAKPPTWAANRMVRRGWGRTIWRVTYRNGRALFTPTIPTMRRMGVNLRMMPAVTGCFGAVGSIATETTKPRRRAAKTTQAAGAAALVFGW